MAELHNALNGGILPDDYYALLEQHAGRFVGRALPDMPLFLQSDRYIKVPLETTYEAAYRGVPAFWRAVLERPSP